MTDTEKAAVGAAVSAGLVNLGNTCYMNFSTMLKTYA